MTITWPGDAGDRSPVVVRKRLMAEGIVTSVRGDRLRVSTHAYNNSDEIQRLVDSLQQVLASSR